ncbi:MAG: flagellar motor protein MotA [Gemmatimonas sp.]
MGTLRVYLIRMALFIVAVAIVVALLAQRLIAVFLANPALNTLILGSAFLGIVYIVRQATRLGPDFTWLAMLTRDRGRAAAAAHGDAPGPKPRLLAPIAVALGDGRTPLKLSPLAARAVLDGIGQRLDEERDIARYLIGLLIFLGLLGTFWGLLDTIRAVGDVVGNLVVGGDVNEAFASLKSGLAAPLAGMGTSFSSSLFGLAGSLVLGFLDLQAGQAQNRFVQTLEEWMSAQTRLSAGTGIATGEEPVPAYVQALLEETAESLGRLERLMARSEERGGQSSGVSVQLVERLGTLAERMKSQETLLVRMAETEVELKGAITKLAEATRAGGTDALAGPVRNIEVYLARLIEEISSGRAQSVEELRSEIRVLARTVAAAQGRPLNPGDR